VDSNPVDPVHIARYSTAGGKNALQRLGEFSKVAQPGTVVPVTAFRSLLSERGAGKPLLSCMRPAFLTRIGTNDAVESVGLSARDASITSLQQLRMPYPKYGDGIEWKLKQDVDFLRDA